MIRHPARNQSQHAKVLSGRGPGLAAIRCWQPGTEGGRHGQQAAPGSPSSQARDKRGDRAAGGGRTELAGKPSGLDLCPRGSGRRSSRCCRPAGQYDGMLRDWLPEAGIGELISLATLTARWQERWPRCRPVGHELRCCARATWVRFHSLPGSKRYAEDDSEYAEILRRHHVLLGEMPEADEVLVVTTAWSGTREPTGREPRLAEVLPDAVYWMPVLADRDDTGWESWTHLYVSMSPWQGGELDPLLRLAADDQASCVIIAPPDPTWLYHPYDGGADVIARHKGERDMLMRRHGDWLPANADGL
jgi:hypothetical protein